MTSTQCFGVDRLRGILAAMRYLSKHKGWILEVDGRGARLKQHVMRYFDLYCSFECEETIVELTWDKKEFKDLTV